MTSAFVLMISYAHTGHPQPPSIPDGRHEVVAGHYNSSPHCNIMWAFFWGQLIPCSQDVYCCKKAGARISWSFTRVGGKYIFLSNIIRSLVKRTENSNGCTSLHCVEGVLVHRRSRKMHAFHGSDRRLHNSFSLLSTCSALSFISPLPYSCYLCAN